MLSHGKIRASFHARSPQLPRKAATPTGLAADLLLIGVDKEGLQLQSLGLVACQRVLGSVVTMRAGRRHFLMNLCT